MKGCVVLTVLVVVGCSITSISTQPCYRRQRGHLSGNVTLGFLFHFYGYNASSQGCSQDVPSLENIQLLEAASMMLSRNEGIPNVIFGLESWDTCSSSHLAVESTLAYLSSQLSPSLDAKDVCSPIIKPGIIASLEYGGQGEAVASLVDGARMPLITFAGTQSSLTKDSPYVLRTLPNDEFEAAGIVQLLQRMNWTYVTTINLNTVQDKAALQSFKQAAKTAGICTTLSQQFSWDSSIDDIGHLINNITSNPIVNVAVIFVSSDSLTKLTAALQQTLGSDSVLQFVLSHRAVLDVTSNVAGLKGALAFRSPSSQTEDEFDDYFQSLTPDTVDPTRNPWFRDYWQKKYRCNLEGLAVFPDNCTNTHVQLHKTMYTRHPYVSYVLDAVRVYINAIEAFYNSTCTRTNQSSLCDSILMADAQQILSQIQQVNLTKADGSRIAFLPSGDFFYSSLEVVNYKMDTHNTYQFLPVGNFIGEKLNLDQRQLELWSRQGMTPVQSVCTPPCMDQACGEPTTLSNETMVYIKGDVILGGLFSIHKWDSSKSSCGELDESGLKRLEAMMYAVDQINRDGTILPAGLTLGMDGLDTCASPEMAGHQVLQFVSKAQFGQSGSGQRPDANGLLEHVFGVVGPNSDEECILVNGVLNVYGMPTVSYGATSSSLSNTAVYKNFARTVFSNSASGVALLNVILGQGWQYAQALRSNTASGRLFVSVLQQTGSRMGVCLTSAQIIPSADDIEEMEEVFTKLTSRPEAKVVFVTATNSDMRRILEQFQNRSLFGQYYLVLVGDWASDPILQRDFADIAPGIIFISEPKRSYSDFLTYFSGLNPGNTLRNPWLSEYWTKKFQCNLPNTPSLYPQDCTGMESLTLDDGTDRRISETVDAVYAIARAISSLHNRYCPGQSHVCPEMTKASGNELFQLLTSRDNFFASITDGYMVQISPYGDVYPHYDIYNIQRMPNGTLVNTKIGIYQNYYYQDVAGNDIIVYRKNGDSFEEIAEPISICKGSCDDCQIKEKLPVAEVSGGDVWIGGLFELHEIDTNQLTCKEDLIHYNVQLVEAFLYAIDNVNSNPNILPELQLGAIAFDTCASADRAHREVLNFVSGTVDYRSGYLQIQPSVIGVIGGETSDTSLRVANVLTPLGINQISYAATTTELSDPSRFPYFLRTVPSDEKQAAAIVDMLVALEWQYISVVYSDDSYGNDLLKGVTQNLAKTSICIAMSLKVAATYERMDYDKVARQLQTNPHARVVLLLTSHMGTREVLEAAERIPASDLQWIGTETWGDRHDVIQNATVTSRGALILRFQQAPSIQAFKEYFTSLQLYTNRRNPWWKTFWEDTFKCNTYGSSRYDVPCPWQPDFESVYMQETGVSNILDAVQLFATGLHNAMIKMCPNTTRYICDDLSSKPAILHRYIQEANITRSDGSVFKVDENGDGEPRFDVLTVQGDGGEGHNSYVKVGSWLAGRLNLTSVIPSVSSTCGGRCAECYVSNKQDTFAHIPGPLQILGLFAAHATGNHVVECGELRNAGIVYLEAMLFAIDKINADPSILKGVNLGATVFDTCARGSRGVRALSSVFSGRLPLGETTAQQSWSLIAGVIGSENEEVTLDTAALAEQYKYVQISYGMVSTDTDLSNLLRMEPTVSNQILAITQLLLHFQWQFVGIISSQSTYRLQQRDAFIKAATSHQLCIGTQEELTAHSSMPTLLQRIYETVDQNVVVLFLDEGDIASFIQAIEMRNDSKHLTWVIAFTSENIQNKYPSNRHLLGAFFINSVQTQIPQFADYFSSLTASSNQRNPWFHEFISRLNDCNGDGGGNSSTECSGGVGAMTVQVVGEYAALITNVINSVYATAHGVQDLLAQYCEGAPGLCAAFVGLEADKLQQAIHNTAFTGLDGSTIIFDHGVSQRQFSISTNKVINGFSKIEKVGSWIGGNLSVQTSQVSFYNLRGEQSTSPVLSQCLATADCSINCSVTRPVTTIAPPSPSTNPVTSTVKRRPTRPTPPMTTISGKAPLRLLSVSNFLSAWFLILVIIAIIGILASVGMIVMFILHWKTPVAQAMSPFLCAMLLMGVILVYLLVPVLAAPPAVLSCAIERVWPGLAFAVCQVAVLLMSMRLYRTSKQVHTISGSMPNFINTSSQLILFVVLMALEVVIVAEWLILQPPGVVASDQGPGTSNSSGLMAVCAYGESTLGPLSYVYVLLACAVIMILLAKRKKDMISRMELMTLSTVIIGSVILVIAWVLLEHLAPLSYHRPGMAIIATIKATMILLLTLPRVKTLTSSNDSFHKTGEYVADETEFETPISQFPTSEDMEEDASVTGSEIQLTDAIVMHKV